MVTASTLREISVFLSSAGDTILERAQAFECITNHNLHHQKEGYILNPMLYERDVPPSKGQPQSVINESVGEAGQYDIAIYIFRQRFGSGTLSELRSGLGSKSCLAMIYCFAESESSQSLIGDQLKVELKHHPCLTKKFHPVDSGRSTNFKSLLERDLVRLALREGYWKLRGTGPRQELLDRVSQYWFRDNSWEDHVNPVPMRITLDGEPEQYQALFGTLANAKGVLRCAVIGKSGSGKSFALLEFVRAQYQNAVLKAARIPFIISAVSWLSSGKPPFEKWLSQELHLTYRIRLRSGKELIAKNEIIPVVDGLDEIAGESGEIDSGFLNQLFAWAEHQPIVLACQDARWETLIQRQHDTYSFSMVRLLGHPDLEDLFDQEVSEIVKRNHLLQEFARLPLHASLIRRIGHLNSRTRLLLKNFSNAELDRKRIIEESVGHAFAGKRTRPLSLLAKLLKPGAPFQIDRIQPNDFPAALPSYRVISALLLGAFVSLIVFASSMPGLFVERLLGGWGVAIATNGAIAASIRAAIFGGASVALGMLSARRWWHFPIFVGIALAGARGFVVGGSLADDLSHVRHDAVEVFLTTVPVFVLFWLVAFRLARIQTAVISPVEIITGSIRTKLSGGIKKGLPLALLVGGSLGVLWGVERGLAFGFLALGLTVAVVALSETKPRRFVSANDGIIRSFKNGVSIGAAGVLFSVFALFFSYLSISWQAGLTNALLGLNVSVAMLVCGMLAVIQHYSLRLALWSNGFLPFHLEEWLEGCVRDGLVKRAGTQFTFLHETWRSFLAQQK